MSQFSRRARWLQQLFPPSVVPTVHDPSIISDDVSLVQQYDGGAIGIAQPTFPPEHSGVTALEISNPEVAIRDFVTTPGIATITDLVLLPNDLYARIMGISTILVASTTPTGFKLDARPPSGSGVGNHISNIGLDIGTIFNTVTRYPIRQDLILPGHQINSVQLGGTATTSIRVTISWIVAPIGALIAIGANGI